MKNGRTVRPQETLPELSLGNVRTVRSPQCRAPQSRTGRTAVHNPLQCPEGSRIGSYGREPDPAAFDSDRKPNAVASQFLFELPRFFPNEFLKPCRVNIVDALPHALLGVHQGVEQQVHLGLLAVRIAADNLRTQICFRRPKSASAGCLLDAISRPSSRQRSLFRQRSILTAYRCERLLNRKRWVTFNRPASLEKLLMTCSTRKRASVGGCGFPPLK